MSAEVFLHIVLKLLVRGYIRMWNIYFAVLLTALSQAQQCRGQRGVKLSNVMDNAESSWTFCFAPQCQWHNVVCQIQNLLDFYGKQIILTPQCHWNHLQYSLTPQCHWHNWVWFCVVIDTAEFYMTPQSQSNFFNSQRYRFCDTNIFTEWKLNL